MPKEIWILIVVVVVLIALYIVYLVASNRRFHRMYDPQIERLRQYEENRRRVVHSQAQGYVNSESGDTMSPPTPVPPVYSQEQDYQWSDKKK